MESKLRSTRTLKEEKLTLLRKLEAAGLGDGASATRLRSELWPDPEDRPAPVPQKVYLMTNGPEALQ